MFFDQWPIPLVASKQNFKSSSCVRSMQRAVVDRALREGELIILGIHLCGVLSLRAVDLFNNNRQSVRLFALKPCCLPGLVYAQRNEIFKIGNHAFSAHEVCAPGKFEAQSKTKVTRTVHTTVLVFSSQANDTYTIIGTLEWSTTKSLAI